MSHRRKLLYLASAMLGMLTCTARLHAQSPQTLSGPDGCSATVYLYGSGNFAGGSITANCPANHNIVVSVTISSSGGGGGSQSETCNAAETCEAQATANAYGTVQGNYTWTVDGVAGQSGHLSLQ